MTLVAACLGAALVAAVAFASARASVVVASRLGAVWLAPTVWIALLGIATWMVTEALSLLGAVTPTGSAAAATVAAITLALATPRFRATAPFAFERDPRWLAVALGIAAVLAVTLLIALVSPPNTWDAMTYHNPRLRHWLVQRSVAHYETTIDRQLRAPPLASFFRLHLFALMGSDVLFNLVQWAFFVVSIVESGVVAWVASREPAAGLLAAAFVASLPMAILQASSSQNDLVVSGYALGAALAVVAARQRETERERRWLVVLAGACLGLACLSKGTGYLLTVILLPAGVIAAGKGGRRGWVMAVAIVLVLNTPHLVRNARRFGDVAPHPEGVTWSAWTGRGVAGRMGSQVWRAAVLQIQPAMRVPASAAVIERATDAVHRVLGVSAQDPRVTWTGSVPFLRRLSPLHEDTAGNPVHFALALVAAVATLARRRREAVVAFLFATGWLAWLVLALAVKWMPWQSRLQLPALVLLAAPAGAWLAARVAPSHRPAMAAVVGLALLATGVPWLVLNASRPLVGIPGRAPSILSRTRWENFFRNRPELQHDVEGLTAALPAECSPTRPVGLHVGGGQWEYALWAGADRARRRLVFEHVPAGDPPRADLCAVVSDRCPAAALCLESP